MINPAYSGISIGDKIGRFTIIGNRFKGLWPTKCECGHEAGIISNALIKLSTRKCGHRKYRIGSTKGGRIVLGRNKNKRLKVQCSGCGTVSIVNPKLNAECPKCVPVKNAFKNNKSGTIYGITCPFTGSVVYVGATTSPLSRRMIAHWSARNFIKSRLYLWMKHMEDVGAKPGAITLESGVDGDSLGSREVFWIQKTIQEGAVLFNKIGRGVK